MTFPNRTMACWQIGVDLDFKARGGISSGSGAIGLASAELFAAKERVVIEFCKLRM
jgi:hypothetical protein